MPTLLDLPTEVLQLIISDVRSIRDISALATQCQTLRGLCDMVNRKKYHRIRLQRGPKLRKATELLLSVLRNPILGTYVRDIEFDNKPSYEKFNWGECNGLEEEEDVARVYSATRRAGFDETEGNRVSGFVLEDAKILRIARTGYGGKFGRSFVDIPEALKCEALAALFISVSPNLESLALCPMVNPRYGIVSLRMAPSTSDNFVPSTLMEFLDRINFDVVKTGALQHLRHIRFVLRIRPTLRVYDDFALLENLNLVHRLPNLSSIRVVAMREIHARSFMQVRDEQFITPCPKSSNISKIHIESSYVTTRYLKLLVDMCKRLTEFTYWTGPVPDIYFLNPRQLGVIAPKTLVRALLSQRRSLEALDLEIDDAIADFDTEEAPLQRQPTLSEQNHDTEPDTKIEGLIGTTGILIHFTSLTRLTLNLRLFFYFATGVRPMGMDGQGRDESQGEGPQSYRPERAGQSSQHDSDITTLEDLELNHTHKLKDEKCQPLIKTLPPRLEYLCILDYHHGFNAWHDFLLSSLMMDVREGKVLPNLKVSGVWEQAFRPWYDFQEEVYSVDSGDEG